MRRKKVLLIHHSGLMGGAGVSLFNMWKALEKDYEITCYIPNDPPELLEFLKSKNLYPRTFDFRLGKITYYSGGNNLLKPRFWYHSFHSLFQIKYWKEVLEREKPDMVLVNSKVLCWMSKLFGEVKSVCFVRETIPAKPNNLMNQIMKKMLEKFSAVVFLSEYDMIQTDLKNTKTIVSPDFLNMKDYEEQITRDIACEYFNINKSSFNVLFAGGTDELKGIDLALQAMSYLKNENIQLIVAGKDHGQIHGRNMRSILKKFKKRKEIRYSNSIRLFIENNNIKHMIKFVGIQKKMSHIFSASDILIFPMKEPHQARPAFEIGVQRKPIIITDFPNIREFIQHEENGLTFKPNNAKDLADCILRLKNSPAFLREIGNSNFEKTKKFHLEEYAMKQLTRAINEII